MGRNTPPLTHEDMAVRAHDITVCLERTSVDDFELLSILGMAVRLSLHLRGVQAVSYSVVRQVAVHLLDFHPLTVDRVLEFLAEAEFVRLYTQGKTIKTVIPDIPYYERMFSEIGSLASQYDFSETELLTLTLVAKLASSPLFQDAAYQLGAEKKLVKRVLEIGTEGSFMISRRARGRSVLLSPSYFSESQDAYADLVAAGGAKRVKKVLTLLKAQQGWPLSKIESQKRLAGVRLDDEDIALIKMLAGEGFVPPPAIETSHAGINYFLFGPRPSKTRLLPAKRPVYEAAMALVAAIRQGQLLPNQYAIRSPLALLNALKDRGYLKANTEAMQQYKQVAALKVARLEQVGSGNWAKLVLIDRPENLDAVDIAIDMISSEEPQIQADEEIILSLRKGEKYIESLIGRKRILKDTVTKPDKETLNAIDSFLLRGR